MSYDDIASLLARGVEIGGIAVLLLGVLLATVVFVRDWMRGDLGLAYKGYRANLGRAIMLGLELLVVADIITTAAIDLTLSNLASLGVLVLIRTFLSIALEVEITGKWPQRQATAIARPQPASGRSITP